MTDYLYYNFTGGVDLRSTMIAIGQNPAKTYWSDSQNIEIYKSGGFARMNGNTLLKSIDGSPKVLGLFEYTKGDEKILVVNTSEGKFYRLNSGGSLSLKKSDLSQTAACNYVNFVNGVICSNGVDEPFFFEDGAETEIRQCNAVYGDHNIRGSAIAIYKGRVWIGDGSTLYYSALGRYDDWETEKDAGYIANFHNDSSKIVALKNYKGYLAIYKENQTYLLMGTDYTDFVIVPFANKGSLAPLGIATIENLQYFYNKGIYTLEQVGELNQLNLSSEVSNLIHPEFNSLDQSRLNEIVAIPYEKKRQVWFYMPYQNITGLKVCWIYDYDNSAWYKRVLPQELSYACTFNDNIYAGTTDGKILIEDSDNTFNGQAIEFYWHSPFFHFGEPNKSKTVDEFYINVDCSYENNFNFSVKKDYVTTEVEDQDSVSIIDSNSLIWADTDGLSGGVWADCSSGNSWATYAEIAERLTISGSNKSVQICIDGNTTTNGCAILGFEFRDVLLDE